jgi:hypothetical protein
VKERPSSAVSLFTAVAAAIILAVGVVSVAPRHWPPVYLVQWFVPVLAVIGFNIWASRGSNRK